MGNMTKICYFTWFIYGIFLFTKSCINYPEWLITVVEIIYFLIFVIHFILLIRFLLLKKGK